MLEARSAVANSPWVFTDEQGTRPLSESTISHQHTKLRQELKLPAGFVLHSLRHTFLTRLGAAGADAFSIKLIAGHSPVTVSEKYIHRTPESLERAFERLEEYNGWAAKSLRGARN